MTVASLLPRSSLVALSGLVALLGAGCFGETGTLSVSVLDAPDSTLLDDVQRIRMTLLTPRTVVEARRSPGGGFQLALEAAADGNPSTLQVEGFDAADELIAYGTTPPFSVGPIDAHVAVFLAPPISMAHAPVLLAVPRFELGVAPLTYGAVMAGGRDNTNGVRGELEIYNAFDHTLARGLDLPQPRAGAAVGATIDGRVFVVGGQGGDGAATSTTWLFNSTVAPAGAYLELTSSAPARTGERAVPISNTRFLLTGAAAQIDAINAVVQPVAGAPALPTQMAAVLAGEEIIAIGAGAATVVRFRGGAFDQLAVPAALRSGHAVVSTADAQIAVIGGQLGAELSADAVKIDPISGAGTVVPAVLEIPRRRAAVARAGAFIVVAGGTSASESILDTAEILDATTLKHLATIPLRAPRAFAEAVALPNDQVLLVGGLDNRGRPSDRLELFTGAPPGFVLGAEAR